MRFIISVVLSLSLLALFASPIHAENQNTEVSLSLGSGQSFSLFGYTSPHANVSMDGIGVSEKTKADSKGYYEFSDIFSPFLSQEVCILSTDTLGRLSSPNCLPPFPVSYSTNIGPVILSPSISVDKSNYYIGQNAVLTGKTIPNTEVKLSFFKDPSRSLFKDLIRSTSVIFPTTIQLKINSALTYLPDFHFIKDVEAFSFPELTSTADSEGNYSISIPTANQSYLRTFVQTQFDKSPSEKSLTLNIKVLPWWTIVLQIIGAVFIALQKFFVPLIFEVEIIILLFILKSYLFHPYRLQRSLMLYKQENALMKREDHPLMNIN